MKGGAVSLADEDSLRGDLWRHLVSELYSVSPADRRLSRWLMNGEWFDEVLSVARAVDASVPGNLEYLLGLPFDVREDGGAPHLVIA